MTSLIRFAGAAVMAVSVLAATESSAGLLDNCATYAQASAKQQQENQIKSCKLTGDFWTTDLKKHVAYCKSVPPQKWKAALAQRAAKLAACK